MTTISRIADEDILKICDEIESRLKPCTSTCVLSSEDFVTIKHILAIYEETTSYFIKACLGFFLLCISAIVFLSIKTGVWK